ncbi:MAG: flavodoxin family protein, partial [Candidatus Freyarchaeota archaeon]
MKILGLVGSYRKYGNTEVLVREALMSASEMGAEVELLRLTDLTIKPCKGCMACVFKNAECRIEDDANFFFSKLFEAGPIPSDINETRKAQKQGGCDNSDWRGPRSRGNHNAGTRQLLHVP